MCPNKVLHMPNAPTVAAHILLPGFPLVAIKNPTGYLTLQILLVALPTILVPNLLCLFLCSLVRQEDLKMISLCSFITHPPVDPCLLMRFSALSSSPSTIKGMMNYFLSHLPCCWEGDEPFTSPLCTHYLPPAACSKTKGLASQGHFSSFF